MRYQTPPTHCQARLEVTGLPCCPTPIEEESLSARREEGSKLPTPQGNRNPARRAHLYYYYYYYYYHYYYPPLSAGPTAVRLTQQLALGGW